MPKLPPDAQPEPRLRQPMPAGLRRLLSVAITGATATTAVFCIHLGASGIQEVQEGVYPVQVLPRAELEFAPLTTTIKLEPARALPPQPDII